MDGFPQYLDPALVPVDDAQADVLSSEFLNYLASWVALTLDQNWDMAKKRTWLSQIVPLYRRRGTFAGIQSYLSVFVGDQATVDEPPGGFVVGGAVVPGSDKRVGAAVGEDTFIAGAPSLLFSRPDRVRVRFNTVQHRRVEEHPHRNASGRGPRKAGSYVLHARRTHTRIHRR